MPGKGKRLKSFFESAARWIVLFAVIVSPWLFGCAEPWAFLLVVILVSLGFGLWLLSLVISSAVMVRTPLLALALLCFLPVLLLQVLPMPDAVVGLLSSKALDIQQTRDAVFDDAGFEGVAGDREGSASRYTLTYCGQATWRSIYLWVSYVGVFLVVAHTAKDWRRVKLIALVLVSAGFVLALFSLIQDLAGTRNIYWYHKPRLGGTSYGPFTNRNHYAAYVNMMVGVALGLFLVFWEDAQHKKRRRSRTRKRRSDELGQLALILLAGAIIAVSTCMSLSRGGITSVAVALGVGAFLLARMHQSLPHGRRMVGSFALLALGVVVWLGWQPMLDRLGTIGEVAMDPVSDSRTIATMDAMKVFVDAPLLGCGYGAFKHVFPSYQSPAIQFGRWWHAHNDWAQGFAEGGLVGMVLFLSILAMLVRLIRQRFPQARSEARFLVVGLCVSLVAIALHSALDYSLHRPANAYLLAAICGLIVAALHCTSLNALGLDYDYIDDVLPGRRVQPVIRVGAVLMVVILVLQTMACVRALDGEVACARFRLVLGVADQVADERDQGRYVKEAVGELDLIVDPAVSPYSLLESAVECLPWLSERHLDPEIRLEMARRATQAAIYATDLAPSDYECWLWLGHLQGLLGRRNRSDACYSRAQALAPPGAELAISRQKE